MHANQVGRIPSNRTRPWSLTPKQPAAGPLPSRLTTVAPGGVVGTSTTLRSLLRPGIFPRAKWQRPDEVPTSDSNLLVSVAVRYDPCEPLLTMTGIGQACLTGSNRLNQPGTNARCGI